MNQSHKLLVCHIQELVKVNATKCELAKSPLFLKNSSLFCCLIVDGRTGEMIIIILGLFIQTYYYYRSDFNAMVHDVTIEILKAT